MSGRHRPRSGGRHRRSDQPRLPGSVLILGLSWLGLVAAPATHGAAVFNPGKVPEVPVLRQPVLASSPVASRSAPRVVAVAAISPRIPPIVGAKGLTPNAVALASYIQQNYPDVVSIGGVRPCDSVGDHCRGVALDVMVFGNTALGNRIEDDVMSQAARFHIKYSIWCETLHRPNGSSYWMADRGSPTQNHYDHVHLSVY